MLVMRKSDSRRLSKYLQVVIKPTRRWEPAMRTRAQKGLLCEACRVNTAQKQGTLWGS